MEPAVLGELLIGVAIGNTLYWLNLPVFVVIMHLHEVEQVFFGIWTKGLSVAGAVAEVFQDSAPASAAIGNQLAGLLTGRGAEDLVIIGMTLWLFSHLGVLFLLFMVGLEMSVAELKGVGSTPFLVAIVGVIVPFSLGIAVSIWLLPQMQQAVHLFVGATLCATSVGITARVFKDLGQLKTPNAVIILGAAVIDDVLALIILAVVVGIVTSGVVDIPEIIWILALSFAFFVVVVSFGERLVAYGARLFRNLDPHTYKVLYPLVLGFLVAWIANLIGLAAIIGAFAAGLMLSEHHFAHDADHAPTVQDMFRPLETVFAPVFFVLMGMQVNLTSLLVADVPLLALALTLAAIIGKLVAGVIVGRRASGLVVGVGMMPRGEVGLIFASFGKASGVVPDFLLSAIVMMVIVTTFVTPVALRWALSER